MMQDDDEPKVKEMSVDDWSKEGVRLFGPDRRDWCFVCPNCGHVQSGRDFIELNEKGVSDVKPETVVYFSCIGRFDTRIPGKEIGTIFDKEPKRQPCDYTNGGLFCFARLMVVDAEGKKHPVFEFAGEESGRLGVDAEKKQREKNHEGILEKHRRWKHARSEGK